MSDIKRDEKNNGIHITQDVEEESNATTLDERLAEIENKSITFPNQQSVAKREQKPLMIHEDIKKPTLVPEKMSSQNNTPSSESASFFINNNSSRVPKLEEEGGSYKALFAFGTGIVLGALITSFFL